MTLEGFLQPPIYFSGIYCALLTFLKRIWTRKKRSELIKFVTPTPYSTRLDHNILVTDCAKQDVCAQKRFRNN